MRNRAQPGSTRSVDLGTDTRAGLQLHWQPQPGLEFTSQAVLYKRPSGTPASEAIELAYAGWRPTQTARVRLGRTSPDVFLFANSRHLGYAWPWIRPPVDMYGFLPLLAVDGVEGSQVWTGGGGDTSWLFRGATGRFRATGSGSFPDLRSFTIQGRDVVLLTAQRSTGALLLKGSVVQARMSLQLPEEVGIVRGALGQLAALPLPGLAEQIDRLQNNLWSAGRVRYLSLGLQYDQGPWLLHTEFSRLEVSTGGLLPTSRGYVSLGYRWNEVTWFGVFGRTRADVAPTLSPRVEVALAPVLGAAGAAQAQGVLDAAATITSAYRHDQRTVSAGLRWDFASNVALKFQVDRVHVSPFGTGLWRSDSGPIGARNTVASIALDFVWEP
jgi:hypothetical protein